VLKQFFNFIFAFLTAARLFEEQKKFGIFKQGITSGLQMRRYDRRVLTRSVSVVL